MTEIMTGTTTEAETMRKETIKMTGETKHINKSWPIKKEPDHQLTGLESRKWNPETQI